MEQPSSSVWPFTETLLLHDVRKGIASILTSVELAVTGHGTARRALGHPGGDDRRWRDDRDLSLDSVPSALEKLFLVRHIMPSQIDAATIDVHRYSANLTFRTLYDYTVHSRWPKGLHLSDFLDDALTFYAMAEAADEYYGFYGVPELCKAVIDQAVARSKLDALTNEDVMGSVWADEGGLTLSDVAVLAGMEEGSVRNAAQRTGERGLTTYREEGRVLVDPEEALRWLRGSKYFQETRFYQLDCQKSLEEGLQTLGEEIQGTSIPGLMEWRFPRPERAPVISLRPVAGLQAGSAPRRSAVVELSENNIKSSSLRITSLIDEFPEDVKGGANRSSRAPKTLTLEFPDGRLARTDIDGRKKIFRDRASIRRFYEAHELKAGDKVRLTWMDPYHIKIEPAGRG